MKKNHENFNEQTVISLKNLIWKKTLTHNWYFEGLRISVNNFGKFKKNIFTGFKKYSELSNTFLL